MYRLHLLLLLVSAAWSAEPVVAPTSWIQAVGTPAYATAASHAPSFTDRALWPQFTGKEDYVTQDWPKARLLVWAKPGENGDWTQPGNWLEDGKPATTAPDRETDVWLPAAERKYAISTRSGETPCRHLTAEKGSNVIGGDSHSIGLYGNCWIKHGGAVGINIVIPKGSHHTFFRNDYAMTRNEVGKPNGNEGAVIGHYIHVEKDKGASVEYLGNVQAADKVYFKSGTTIIGPDSCIMSGGWNRPVVEAPATLVLMDGAWTGQRDFNDGRFADDSLRVDGILMAGTPQRPITRDVTLGLCHKDTGTYRNARGMLVNQSGKLVVHSADPTKARLVFRWSGVDENWPEKGLFMNADVPRKISVAFLGDVRLDGALFMDLDRGGLQLADPAQKAAWKNIEFGAGCAGAAEVYGTYARQVGKEKKKDAAEVQRQPGKAPWEGQVWDKVRVLTWAKPGQDGDPDIAGNWMENGKPAGSGPDRTSDLVLPAASRSYTVGGPATRHIGTRHLTIEKGATLAAGQVIAGGNVWIKEGGDLRLRDGLGIKGSSHSFLRNDNPVKRDAEGRPQRTPGTFWLKELVLAKGSTGDDTSVECLGFISADTLTPAVWNNQLARRLGTRRLIVGPDATVVYGWFSSDRRSASQCENFIQLQSGAVLCVDGQRTARNNVEHLRETEACLAFNFYENGLEAGSVERPLVKDARLLLSGIPQGKPADRINSLCLPDGQGTRLAVVSADPAKARLVIAANREGGADDRISVLISGKCSVDAIVFDDVIKGGLRIGAIGDRAAWRNVALGARCQGGMADLLAK